MKKMLSASCITVVFCFTLGLLTAQTNMLADIPNQDPANPVYSYVEKMPLPMGSQDVMDEYLKFYPYPACALDNNLQGKVILSFIVEKNGKLSNVKVIRSPNDCLGKAALDYINYWPDWAPGKVADQPVRTLFTLPIDYSLENYNNRPK